MELGTAPAEALLDKLKRFIREELDPQERSLFAALLAPGVAAAHADQDVVGFGMTAWSPPALPDALTDALDHYGVRISGLDL